AEVIFVLNSSSCALSGDLGSPLCACDLHDLTPSHPGRPRSLEADLLFAFLQMWQCQPRATIGTSGNLAPCTGMSGRCSIKRGNCRVHFRRTDCLSVRDNMRMLSPRVPRCCYSTVHHRSSRM